VASSQLSGDWDDSSTIFTIDILPSFTPAPESALRGKVLRQGCRSSAFARI
jgi:hypothetical protein